MSDSSGNMNMDMGGSDNTSNIIAIVSLIISIIAFVVAVAQALQQYLASAEGYRKCAWPVMGQWANATRRRFRWDEVRFEVLFETPVLFVSKPENDRGPIKGRPITSLDGTDESYKASNTMDENAQEAEDREAESKEDSKFRRVHTIDDARATWVTLLMMLQNAERAGRAWDAKHALTPKGIKYDPPQYNLVVQMQKRKRSWDYVPESVLKPYAQTTVGHLAELTVMLGMRWRTFDPDTFNLRAEGNGLILTSSQYQGLGLGVSFTVYGKAIFEGRRTVPNILIRKFVFGCVPTLFDDLSLQFGGDVEIRRTLQVISCKQDAIERYFRRRDHVRSVSFELVGMLSAALRVRGSSFRIVPNPTRDPWNTSFNCLKLVHEVSSQIRNLASIPSSSTCIRRLADSCAEFLSELSAKDATPIDIDLLEKTHDTLDNVDEWLLSQPRNTVISVAGSHVSSVLSQLADLDSFLSSRDCDTEAELIEHYFDDIRPLVMSANIGSNMGMDGSARTSATDWTGSTPTTAHPIHAEKMRSREDTWVTLMWRMVLWGVLHDYDAGDLNVLPGRLMGTRLPVYIV